jgi:GxxExxY protein
MHENEVAREIVDSAYKIHRSLGPGLLESAYAKTMIYELRTRGLFVARQPRIPILYESICIDDSFRADLIVEEIVIVELKSIEAIAAVHLQAIADLPASERVASRTPDQLQCRTDQRRNQAGCEQPGRVRFSVDSE